MVRSIYYNGNRYETRSENDKWKGFALASIASAAILSPLGYLGKPFQKQLIREQGNNYLYRDALYKAFDISKLKDKGVTFIKGQELGGTSPFATGHNACYVPETRQVIVNTDKIAISGFHELGHALNHLQSKIPRLLQHMRKPGIAIAGLMEYFAIFSRTKPKGQKRNLADYIEDNCGKIAFFSLLPMVIEEAIATHKGIKLARAANLSEPLIKNMKKFLAKALLTYGGYAVLGSLAIFASRKITDYYTRPIKVDEDNNNNFMGLFG